MTTNNRETVAVYLDDSTEPLLEGRPPVAVEIDTCALEDGEHQLRVEAWDSVGSKGFRRLPFQVRNGPAIVVSGLSAGSVVHGKLSMVVHAYGESARDRFEPELAEVPAPIPTWAWVLLIAVIAWAMFYVVSSHRTETSEPHIIGRFPLNVACSELDQERCEFPSHLSYTAPHPCAASRLVCEPSMIS